MAGTLTERLRAALADRYRLGRELGSGGMATVYLAEDLKHHREVAIKVLHPDLAAALGAERFLAEIRTTANLQHPHILPLHDSGEADGLLYYVMPYVEGESLRQRLVREGRLSVDEAVRITREVADALDCAHDQGVIHRDIKPENILLSRGHALVADFGIARALDDDGSRLTATGLTIGTPAYMSPEQAEGTSDITPRSDLYSLACLTFEMLTGEPPHAGTSPRAIMTRRLTGPAPSPRQLRPDVPVAVDQAVTRGLATLPEDRFGRAGEYASALVTGAGLAGGPAVPWRRLLAVALLVVAGIALIPMLTKRPAGPLPAVAEHLARGNELLARRTPATAAEALDAYQAALVLAPTSAEVLARIGYTYALFVDWGWPYQGIGAADLRARAMEFSERAIAADSNSAEAWLARAYVLVNNDPYRMRGALEAFGRSLSLDSTSSEAWYQLGQTAMALGENTQAAAAYRRAFALDPNRPMALMSLSAIEQQQGRIAEARRLIDSAVAASRTASSPYVRVVRGRLDLLEGNVRAARDEAELALAMDTTYSIPARALLASVYWAERDTVRAAAELERLVAAVGPGDPSPTSARYVASALLAQGRREEAITLIERARPRGAYLWFYLQALEFRPLLADPRFRRVHDEADPRPASARPER